MKDTYALSSDARNSSIGNTLRLTAQRVPEKIAIVCGDVVWTYADFDANCDRLAFALMARGISQGDRVAILARNSHAFAAMRFALARIGAVLVPINFMLKAQEIAFILQRSGAKMLLVGAGFEAVADAAVRDAPGVREWVWLPGEDGTAVAPEHMASFRELLETNHQPVELPQVDSRSLLQIVYTSGTESSPKGAMLTHEAVMWEYVSCIADAGIGSSDVVLHALPLYHCAQLDIFLGPAVYVGATNVITGWPRPELLIKLIEQHGISSFFSPPSVWISLLRHEDFNANALRSLEKGYYGASIMPVEVLKEMRDRLPRVRLWNLYGQTEISPLAAVLKPEDQLARAGAAGRPVLNVETRIVDDEMRDVQIGEVGEIVHRSPQLMIAYYEDEERTSEAFKGGWFHSGDLAVRDADGYITVIDRKKDMIKTGGENVASREVEEAIFRMPAVSEVAVISLPDPYWVEAVTAVIVLRDGRQASEADVKEFCRASLAHFKVPKRVIFVDTLPKNPSGKLLKRELRKLYKPADT